MATIKSFTSLEQSKKLAEILPLESADHFHIIGHLHTDGPRYEVIRSRNEVVETDKYWPCWSLVALLDALPVGIELHKQSDGSMSYYYVEVYNNKEYFSTKRYVNPIDACYEMILKLYELNLL